MKLEDQVCSLELAKKLLTLGVNKNSLFYWVLTKNEYVLTWVIGESDNIVDNITPINSYSAFTVAELGEMLPEEVDTFKGNHTWRWECSFHSGNDYHSKSGAETEADARAKMLICLLENKLIELQK